MATLMAVLSLFSCSKVNHVRVDNEIVMSPFASSQTKADLGTENEFGVFAYYSKCQGGEPWNSSEAWGSAESKSYFADAIFEHKGEFWAGKDQAYYWPFSGSLMFAGYCPHSADSKGTIAEVDFVDLYKEEYNPYLEIDFKQNIAQGDMVDLLWFDVKDVAGGKTLAKASDPIPVHFKHAMSKVSFVFVDLSQHYTLNTVTLNGVVNEGTFYSGNTPGWMPNLNKETLAAYTLLAGSELLDEEDGWESGDLYVIPQYLDGIFPTIGEVLDSGVDVVLAFTIEDGFGSQQIEILLKEHTERWELGKSYQYTITVNADAIDFGAPSIDVLPQISVL